MGVIARLFDGVDDIISATITALAAAADWTIAVWVYPLSAGEASNGTMVAIETTGAAARQRLRFNAAGRTLVANQSFTATIAQTVTTTTLPTSTWSLVVVTFRASDNKLRIYIGDPATAMTEAAYASQVAGSGTQNAAGVNAYIGNNSATTNTFDGRLAEVLITGREWSLNEMEEFRLGRRSIPAGNMRGFWPLDSPTAAQAEDLSGNTANGTVTGATVAEGPPLPMNWGEQSRTVLVVTVVSVAGSQATETDTANAGTAAVTVAGSQATETDTANAGVQIIAAAGAQATETDTANVGTPAVVVAGGLATETDTANGGVGVFAVAGSQATETDIANGGTSSVTATGAQATETDTANGGVPALLVSGNLATETDTANASTAAVVVDGQLVAEVESAFAGSALVLLAGAQATSGSSAGGGALLVAVGGALASETDEALVGVAIGGAVVVGPSDRRGCAVVGTASDRSGCWPPGDVMDRRTGLVLVGVGAYPSEDAYPSTSTYPSEG